MTDRTRIIPEDLGAVRENLLALPDKPVKLTAQNACLDSERGLILQRNLVRQVSGCEL